MNNFITLKNKITIAKNENNDTVFYHYTISDFRKKVINLDNFTDAVIMIEGSRIYAGTLAEFEKMIEKIIALLNKYDVNYYDSDIIIDELNIKPLFTALNKLGFKLEVPTFNSNSDKIRLTKKVKNFFGEKIYNKIGHNSFRIVKIENMINDILISYILTGVNDNKRQVLSEYIKKEF